jgi:predicted short-subunit dehydrogenase-like oxidoreductase (DUF2520 family)
MLLSTMVRSQTRPSITLIGSGSLAQALGPALQKKGYKIDSVVTRNISESRRRAGKLARMVRANVINLQQFGPGAPITWLLHTDDALAESARVLAMHSGWKGKLVFHSSGALTSDVLAPLKRAGAYTASVHPMMTFVPGSTPEISGVPFALEGDRPAVAAAKRIVRNLGGEAFSIASKSKVLYHALGSLSSPMMVATMATAERVGRAAGLSPAQTRKLMRPILEQTIKNYFSKGPAAAFSGPIKRGDLETVRRHLHELQRVQGAAEVYRSLARVALVELPSAKKKELLKLLKPFP